MKVRFFLLGVMVILLGAFLLVGNLNTTAWAEPSCTNWMQQGDGTWWMECVNDDGTQHCYWADANGQHVTEISCK